MGEGHFFSLLPPPPPFHAFLSFINCPINKMRGQIKSKQNIYSSCLVVSTPSAPPVTLLPDARYDEVMTAFGGQGFLVRTEEELRRALELSLSEWERPSLINVLIDPASDRKQQVTGAGGTLASQAFRHAERCVS